MFVVWRRSEMLESTSNDFSQGKSEFLSCASKTVVSEWSGALRHSINRFYNVGLLKRGCRDEVLHEKIDLSCHTLLNLKLRFHVMHSLNEYL